MHARPAARAGSKAIGFEQGDPVPAIAQPRGAWAVEALGDLPTVREGMREEIGERNHRPVPFALADPVERVLLVATELAGNAVRHAGPEATVRLLRSAGGWMIKVADSRPDAPPQLPGASTGRRGLRIVDALSRGTGWCLDGETKHVWAFVPDDPPEELVRTLRPPDL